MLAARNHNCSTLCPAQPLQLYPSAMAQQPVPHRRRSCHAGLACFLYITPTCVTSTSTPRWPSTSAGHWPHPCIMAFIRGQGCISKDEHIRVCMQHVQKASKCLHPVSHAHMQGDTCGRMWCNEAIKCPRKHAHGYLTGKDPTRSAHVNVIPWVRHDPTKHGCHSSSML